MPRFRREALPEFTWIRGPNLAKGQILANVALCRVFQWQTFVHVQGEGPVRVHVQPLQRRQSAQDAHGLTLRLVFPRRETYGVALFRLSNSR